MESTLQETEVHPAAQIARRYLMEHPMTISEKEAIYSTAISGNRLAEICASTLTRLEKKQPVSDRYLMGLAWMVYSLRESK